MESEVPRNRTDEEPMRPVVDLASRRRRGGAMMRAVSGGEAAAPVQLEQFYDLSVDDAEHARLERVRFNGAVRMHFAKELSISDQVAIELKSKSLLRGRWPAVETSSAGVMIVFAVHDAADGTEELLARFARSIVRGFELKGVTCDIEVALDQDMLWRERILA